MASPYPNDSDDQDPPSIGCSLTTETEYVNQIGTYADEMMATCTTTDLQGEGLWSNFLTAFHPASITNWSRAQVTTWVRSLNIPVIYGTRYHIKRRWSAVVDLLCPAENLPVCTSTSVGILMPTGSPTRNPARNHRRKTMVRIPSYTSTTVKKDTVRTD